MGDMGVYCFSRRSSSRSTAERMKSERFSRSAHTASMRASVPAGKRAGVCSSLILGRPTVGRISDITFSAKPCIFMISPIDDVIDIIYPYMISDTEASVTIAQTNQPKLSKRAQQALDVLANGGAMVHRLERNNYTGREQFQTRFCASSAWNSAVKGLGFATRCELEDAGFRFHRTHSSSVATYYKLDHSA